MGKPCGVVLVLLAWFAMGAFAFGSEFGNIHFGQVYVHPRIGVEATYDDNLFLLGEERVDDVFFTIRPGIDFDFNRAGKSARLNYLSEIVRYVDYSDYNHENHLADVAVDLQFVSGLMVFIGDSFRKTTDRLTWEEEPLVRRTQNTGDIKAGYEFTDRLSFQAAYDHVTLDYEDAYGPDGRFREYSTFDRNEDRVSGTLFYRIFQRVSLLGQVQYIKIDYEREVVGPSFQRRYDGDGIGGWLGVTGQLTPKMTALVKAGYQEREYDDGKEWSGGVFSIDLVHRVTDTLRLTVGASRNAVESTYSTYDYFTSTEGRVGVEKEIGPKVTVMVSGFYASHDYPEAPAGATEREDDIWGARVALRYDIQSWLSTSISYTHEGRNSNQNLFDYDDNRVSLGVSGVF